MKKLIAAVLFICAAVVFLPVETLALSPSYPVSETYAGGEFNTRLSGVELTGDWRVDLVNVALSQIGYHEGNSKGDYAGTNFAGGENFIEYGSVYGGIDAQWCAMFVSWCARQADIPKYVINSASRAATDGYGGTGRYYFHLRSSRKENYTPVMGDIVFFSHSGYGTDHVGIVADVTDTGIVTVEGNCLNSVRLNYYDFDSDYIVRYGIYAQPTDNKAGEYQYSELEFVHSEGLHGHVPGEEDCYSFNKLLATNGSWFSFPPNAYERGGCKLLGYFAQRTDTGEWYCENGWQSRDILLSANKKPYLFEDGASVMFHGELAEAERIKMYCLWENANGMMVFDSTMPPFNSPDELDWINPYSDIARGDWFYESVRSANTAGLINDKEDFRFMPYSDCSRKNFIDWLYCISGSPEPGEEAVPFSDVDSEDAAVKWAAGNKIIYGVSETEFAPGASLSREQAAAILFRMLKGEPTDGEPDFLDADDISPWAAEAVVWAQGEGIIAGIAVRDGYEFLPGKNLSRAEAVSLVLRIEGVE